MPTPRAGPVDASLKSIPQKDEPPAPDRPRDRRPALSLDLSPESMARVRSALDKPVSILTVPDQQADFSVHIEERIPLQEIFETPPWITPGVAPGWGSIGTRPFSTPAVSVDVLPMLQAAKRAYSERAARDEVKREIAEYCAAQPNGGAGIQICAASAGR